MLMDVILQTHGQAPSYLKQAQPWRLVERDGQSFINGCKGHRAPSLATCPGDIMLDEDIYYADVCSLTCVPVPNLAITTARLLVCS